MTEKTTGSQQGPVFERYTSALRAQGNILKDHSGALAQEVREYVGSQKELWNQVPNLALEADGRSGYLDDFSLAYHRKMWRLPDSPLLVDLTTGDIILPRYKLVEDKPVARLADHPEALNAQGLVTKLQEKMQEEYFGGYNPRKIAQWRADIREADTFLTETLDPSLSLEGQAGALRRVISEIEEAALLPGSELTLIQAKNAVGHVLRASNFDDQEDGTKPIEIELPFIREAGIVLPFSPALYPPTRLEIRGAQEVMKNAAFYIQLRSAQFTPLFAELSKIVWHTAVNATAKVRHERGMVHRRNSEWTYRALGEEYLKRAGGNQYSFAPLRSEPLRPEAPIGVKGFLTAENIADWFLETSAEL